MAAFAEGFRLRVEGEREGVATGLDLAGAF